MTKETLFELMGEIDDRFLKQPKPSRKAPYFLAAACLICVLSATIPFLWQVLEHKGNISTDDSLPPIELITFSGAYYEVVESADTLTRYGLPATITDEMVGEEIGTGETDGGEETPFFRYLPYSHITTKLDDLNPARPQRAVYLVKEGDGYAFALFCNYLSFDGNTHAEMAELLSVYGIDEMSDIKSICFGGEIISDKAEIERVYALLESSLAMGNEDFQKKVFSSLPEAEQQALSIELADNAVPFHFTTTEGMVTSTMTYYPQLQMVSWSLGYYQLSGEL